MGEAEFSNAYQPLEQNEFEVMQREHVLWLRSGGQDGKRMHCRDADLTGCLLAGVDLSGANLRGCYLRGMDLSKTIFQDVDLTEADLSEATLRGVVLHQATLNNVQAGKAVFAGADMSFVSAMNANFVQADMQDTQLVQTNLREANFSGALMMRANLSQANMRGVEMTDANLSGANLEHADLRNGICYRTLFDNARVHGTFLKGTALDGVNFVKTDFSEAIDLSEEYRMQAFQQQQEMIEVKKAEVEQARRELEQREGVVLKEKQEVESRTNLFASLGEVEDELAKEFEVITQRGQILTGVWAVMILLFAIGMAVLASSVPPEKLKLVELTVVFGVMLLVLVLFGASAYVPQLCIKKMKTHRALRERKLSLYHNGEKEQKQASEAPSSTLAGGPRLTQ